CDRWHVLAFQPLSRGQCNTSVFCLVLHLHAPAQPFVRLAGQRPAQGGVIGVPVALETDLISVAEILERARRSGLALIDHRSSPAPRERAGSARAGRRVWTPAGRSAFYPIS